MIIAHNIITMTFEVEDIVTYLLDITSILFLVAFLIFAAQMNLSCGFDECRRIGK